MSLPPAYYALINLHKGKLEFIKLILYKYTKSCDNTAFNGLADTRFRNVKYCLELFYIALFEKKNPYMHYVYISNFFKLIFLDNI